MCNYHFVTDTNEIKEAGDLIHPISNGLSMWWKWTSGAAALDVERQKSGLMAPPLPPPFPSPLQPPQDNLPDIFIYKIGSSFTKPDWVQIIA
jgi:hypothetical protein